jgi:hypothetical protein
MKNITTSTLRLLLSGAVTALALMATSGAQAQAYVNATVGGELAPGVYGRINIGNAMPPPPVIYAEPVIIQRPAVIVQRSPIYLYVPPGHAKNWSKHCARYNACSQPVYFVQEPPPRRGSSYHGSYGHDDRRWDKDHKHGGKDKHKDKDKDKDKHKHKRDDDRGHGHGHRN